MFFRHQFLGVSSLMFYTRERDKFIDGFIIVDSRTRSKFVVSNVELTEMLQRGISVFGVVLLNDGTLLKQELNEEFSKLFSLCEGDAIAVMMPEYQMWLTLRYKGERHDRFVFQLGRGIFKLSVSDIVKGHYSFSFSHINQVTSVNLEIKDDFRDEALCSNSDTASSAEKIKNSLDAVLASVNTFTE